MEEVEKGDLVRLHYTGKLENGKVFDKTQENKPFEFYIGKGTVLPKFEDAILGMKDGEKKTFKVKPEDAYGQRRDELVVEVLKENLPKDLKPQVGQILEIRQKDSNAITQVEILRISENSISIDANHPLAGHELTFEVEIVKVGKAQTK